MRFMRAKALAAMLGVDRSTIWRWAKSSEFPRAYRLGPNTVAWDEAEVHAWIAARARGPQRSGGHHHAEGEASSE